MARYPALTTPYATPTTAERVTPGRCRQFVPGVAHTLREKFAPLVRWSRMAPRDHQQPPATRGRGTSGRDSPMPVAVGQQAPDFTLTSSSREQVTLSEVLKEKIAVLGFYFFAFTGG